MTKITDHGFKPGGYEFLEIESLEVAQWCRDSEGKLPPEQVHMQVNVKGSRVPFVMRFKSPETLGLLIEQLTRHRREVWPHASIMEDKKSE